MVRLAASAVKLPRTPATSGAPLAPRMLDDTGLPEGFLIDLLIRHLERAGELRAGELAHRVCLALSVIEPTLNFLRLTKLLEVPRRGTFDADVAYSLTDAGKDRAREAFEKCRYVGPAPVTLAEYAARVDAQSAHREPVDEPSIRAALGSAVVSDALVMQLGAAINSGKALYLYGPSGSGKTYLAERLVGVLRGSIWVPHAIFVDGEIIQVFDPLIHRPVERPAESGVLERDAQGDRRWVLTRRPVVVTGGELTLATLDLEFEHLSRFYIAPPQVKANNGMMILDDLGRQRVPARDLMNRWIVPLDRGVDYMTLHTGTKFRVPFDVGVVFSSNLAPGQLGDPAFARRLGYKLHLGALDEPGYRAVFRQACERSGIEHRDDAADFLIRELHRSAGMPLYPTIPFDVVSKLRDRARFVGSEPALSPDGMRWAWDLYFAPDLDQVGVPSLDDSR
jgi:predicted ATPase with chaperone activity